MSTIPRGGTTSVYNAENLLTERDFGGVGQTPLRMDLTYTVRNQVATVTRYSDLTATTKVGETDTTYDDAGRTTQITHKDGSGSVILQTTYTYDLASRLETEMIDGSTHTLTYDAVNQLTDDGSTSYSFDLAGNRTMSGYQTGTGNQLTNDGVYTYTYDAEGNRVSKSKSASDESWTFGYSVPNQMTWMEERATSGGTLLLRVEEKYDALGRRIEESRWTSATGTVTTRFTYQGDNVWADLDGSNALVMRYVRPDGVDALGARINAAGVASWYLTDRQGTVQGNTDASGALSNKNSYHGFGARTNQSNASASDRYLYTGRELQVDSGLQYNRARWYDTRTGSWTTIDPRGFDAGDDNLYRYVKNGPTNATDPTGQYLVLSDRKVAERVIERWKRAGLGSAAKIEVTDLPSSRVVVHVSNLEKAGGIPQRLDAKDQELLDQAAWVGAARFAGADDGRSKLEYVSDDNSPQRDQDFLWNLHAAEYKRMVAVQREQRRRALLTRAGESLNLQWGPLEQINLLQPRRDLLITNWLLESEVQKIVEEERRRAFFVSGSANVGKMVAKGKVKSVWKEFVRAYMLSGPETMFSPSLAFLEWEHKLVSPTTPFRKPDGFQYLSAEEQDQVLEAFWKEEWEPDPSQQGRIHYGIIPPPGSISSAWARGIRSIPTDRGVGGEPPIPGKPSAPTTGLTPQRVVNGGWLRDEVAGVELRPGIYDSGTGRLHIGDGAAGHMGTARATGLADTPGSQLSGLVIIRQGGRTYFVQHSGWFQRPLTAAEQAAVARGLEAEFGVPAVYGTPPGSGTINRPGGAIPGNP